MVKSRKRFGPGSGLLVFLAGFAAAGVACRLPPPATEGACVEWRGAFDLGSGSIKMKVAKVDACRGRLLEVIGAKQVVRAHRDALARDGQKLSAPVLAKSAQVIRALKGHSPVRPASWAGVATEVFREAKNGAEAVTWLSRETGVVLRIISQQTEAALGFELVARRVGAVRREDLVVWDLGGGSTQVSTWSQGKLAALLTAHGALSFKHLVLRLEGRDPATTHSPNPILPGVAKRASELVREALMAQNPELRARLARAAKKRVVGIGAVLARSVLPVVAPGSHSFTRAQLDAGLERRLGLSDLELVRAGCAPRFVDTAVSNLLLVQAYMSALGIDEVTVDDQDLTAAVLVDPEFWPARSSLKKGDERVQGRAREAVRGAAVAHPADRAR